MNLNRLAGAWLVLSAVLLAAPVANAQGCGPSNPNCIVTTMPLGDASNRAASDAFVQNALGAFVPSLTVGSTVINGGTPNGLLYDAAGKLGNLATGNNGVLVTDVTGIPSISTTLPGGLTVNGAFAISATNPTLGAPSIGFEPLTLLGGVVSNVLLNSSGVNTGTAAVYGAMENQKGGVTAGVWGAIKDSVGSENYAAVGIFQPFTTGGGSGSAGFFSFRPNLAGTAKPNPVPYNGHYGIGIFNEITNATVANAAMGIYINSLCFPDTAPLAPNCAPGAAGDDTFVVGVNIASARDEMLRFGSTTYNGYLAPKVIVSYNRTTTPVFYLDDTGNIHAQTYYLNSHSGDFKVLEYDGASVDIRNGAGTANIGLNPTGDFFSNASHVFRNASANITWANIDTSGLTLGMAGTKAGALIFANATSGTDTINPATGALGTLVHTLPNVSGTFAVTASAPVVLNATTGNLTCPTCVTSSGGGAISGTSPIAVSAAGVVSINAPYTSITAVSGGIPYFSSTVAMASSALLTANALMVGGGAGTAPAVLASLGTTTTLLHGNAGGAPSFAAVVSADMNITTTTCTNQFVTAISAGGVGTCTTDTLASAQHANQGTTTTVLHGNASGNPSFAAVSMTADITGITPYANGGSNANTSWTQGSVLFAGASAFAQDNANFFWDASNHRLGIGTVSPTNQLSFTGQSAQTIWMERETTSSTAGNNLTIQAGGAISGGSNLTGGNLILSAGTATGNAGTGNATQGVIQFFGPNLGAAGGATADVAPALFMQASNISNFGTVCFGVSGVTCSASSYHFQGNNTFSIFNVPSGAGSVLFRAGGTTYLTMTSTLLSAAANMSIGMTTAAWVNTAPSVASGFCTTPSITANGTAAFKITIGSGCAGSTGTLTMPTAANGWACHFANLTTVASQPWQTGGSTTSVIVTNFVRTTGVAGNFTSADVIAAECTAY